MEKSMRILCGIVDLSSCRSNSKKSDTSHNLTLTPPRKQMDTTLYK